MTHWCHNSIKSKRTLCNVCEALKTHSCFFPTSNRLHCWLLFKVHFSMFAGARQAGLSISDTDLLRFTEDCPKKRKYPASSTWSSLNPQPPALRRCIFCTYGLCACGSECKLIRKGKKTPLSGMIILLWTLQRSRFVSSKSFYISSEVSVIQKSQTLNNYVFISLSEYDGGFLYFF